MTFSATQSVAAIAGSYVDPWYVFDWDNASRSFTGTISSMDGFTGEHFDGERMGFGVEGKTGEILYFAIEDAVMCDDDHVDYWIVKPTSTRGFELFDFAHIYNG